jgi:hypothetical protein
MQKAARMLVKILKERLTSEEVSQINQKGIVKAMKFMHKNSKSNHDHYDNNIQIYIKGIFRDCHTMPKRIVLRNNYNKFYIKPMLYVLTSGENWMN